MTGDTLTTLRRRSDDTLTTAESAFCLRVADREPSLQDPSVPARTTPSAPRAAPPVSQRASRMRRGCRRPTSRAASRARAGVLPPFVRWHAASRSRGMTCAIPGCSLPRLARGLCSAHYWRTRRRERPLSLRVALQPGAPVRRGRPAVSLRVKTAACAPRGWRCPGRSRAPRRPRRFSHRGRSLAKSR